MKGSGQRYPKCLCSERDRQGVQHCIEAGPVEDGGGASDAPAAAWVDAGHVERLMELYQSDGIDTGRGKRRRLNKQTPDSEAGALKTILHRQVVAVAK